VNSVNERRTRSMLTGRRSGWRAIIASTSSLSATGTRSFTLAAGFGGMTALSTGRYLGLLCSRGTVNTSYRVTPSA